MNMPAVCRASFPQRGQITSSSAGDMLGWAPIELAAGTVTGIGGHGNAYTSIASSQYEPLGISPGAAVRIVLADTAMAARLGLRYTDVAPGAVVAVLHPEGLTLAVRDGDFAAAFHVAVGDSFRVYALPGP